MRTEQERGQLRSILGSPQWLAVTQLADELCVKIKSDAVSTDNEWESLRAYVLAEGKVAGIRQLLQEIGREANAEIPQGSGFGHDFTGAG